MKAAIFYLALALLVIPVFPHFPSPNEMSRWALAVAAAGIVAPIGALDHREADDLREQRLSQPTDLRVPLARRRIRQQFAAQ